MTDLSKRQSRFPDASEDLRRTREMPETPQTASPSYRLAFADPEFLQRDELRPVRLQLELLKTEMSMIERGITSTVAMLGSARIPAPEVAESTEHPGLAAMTGYYAQAQEFARLGTIRSVASGNCEGVICTGGGPGIMEAGNRGALDAGGVSISLNIVLPHEQVPNLFGTPDLSFNFHYFAIRKMHFLMRARAVAVFPGGFGTFDELFETLTLVQTKRMEPLPIVMFGREFWERAMNLEVLVEAGTISAKDLDLFRYVETAEEAWDYIDGWKAE
ncbi:LOG family protein [Amaricoccus tamworthensis]|uniref:LOG family protein n=1 Tax=Amaricoccus tamworthensis TaxID=57002 RepID=UPI003C7C15B0